MKCLVIKNIKTFDHSHIRIMQKNLRNNYVTQLIWNDRNKMSRENRSNLMYVFDFESQRKKKQKVGI